MMAHNAESKLCFLPQGCNNHCDLKSSKKKDLLKERGNLLMTVTVTKDLFFTPTSVKGCGWGRVLLVEGRRCASSVASSS